MDLILYELVSFYLRENPDISAAGALSAQILRTKRTIISTTFSRRWVM